MASAYRRPELCRGFNNDDRWGHRANEPNKAVICSLALARLRTDIKGTELANSNAVGMAQKLLLFWRKPARRCWWEGVELENVEGVEGKLKVWIRRVWTLEMVSDNFLSLLWGFRRGSLVRMLGSSSADSTSIHRASSGYVDQALLETRFLRNCCIGFRSACLAYIIPPSASCCRYWVVFSA